MNDYKEIEELLKSDRPAEAIDLASAHLASHHDDARLLFLRGKALWRLGRRAEAMTDYATAATLEPDGPAARALEHARDIANFFNPDLLNP